MMKCKQVRSWLPELVGGELGPRETRLSEEHVEACPACARQRIELERAVSLLRRAGQAMAVPRAFAQGLHLRLVKEPPPARPAWARLGGLLDTLRMDGGQRLGLLLGAAALGAVIMALAPWLVQLGSRGVALPAQPEAEAAAPFQVPSRRVAVVHLEFVTDVVVDNVEFEVSLPQGLAFIDGGRPLPDRTLHWIGSLSQGSNPIPLAVSGSKPGRYKITARARGNGVDVEHDVVLEVVSS